MVLESISNPFNAETHPAKLLLIGGLYALLGLAFGYLLFPQYASIVMVFFVTAASIPLLYNMLRYEEDKDYQELEEKLLIKEHGKAVWAYFMLFVGVTLALTAAFVMMPDEYLRPLFGSQMDTLQAINPGAQVVGASTEVTGEAGGMSYFSRIFLNNIRVLGYCLVFSFLYGAGAIFILTWNASVIALAIGNKLRMGLSALLADFGFTGMAKYFGMSSWVILVRYGIHGSLEILAYIAAGLAGGIISVAVMRHHFSSDKFEHIVIDAADLVLLSIAILFLAGVWEAFLTPLLSGPFY